MFYAGTNGVEANHADSLFCGDFVTFPDPAFDAIDVDVRDLYHDKVPHLQLPEGISEEQLYFPMNIARLYEVPSLRLSGVHFAGAEPSLF